MKKDNKREKSLKAFVEKIDNMKKVNPKDLSSDQDLSIAIMNLISIEEHLIFSGAKTGKTSFYDLIEEIRDMRKTLMQKMIKAYEGEVWCISKHLLGAAYRLMEVGTKQQSMGNTKEAYDLFDKAYELYCLFWGLNTNAINLKDVEWVKDAGIDVKEIEEHLSNIKIANQDVKSSKSISKEEKKTTKISKLKEAVKKAVNCCIE
ncbi:MAG: hypothetical protein J6J27_00520 [Alphaproteobacteria bacterium]|nr:hypothetical protein [Alphaproteobacteria bacterium]